MDFEDGNGRSSRLCFTPSGAHGVQLNRHVRQTSLAQPVLHRVTWRERNKTQNLRKNKEKENSLYFSLSLLG